MSGPDFERTEGDDAAWARIAGDPRLASAIDSVRRVSGLPLKRDEAPTFAPRRGAVAPRPSGEKRQEAEAPPVSAPPRSAGASDPAGERKASPDSAHEKPAGRADPQPRPDDRPEAPPPAARHRSPPADPVPTLRSRRLVRREGLARSLALAAAVALLLHVAVILAFGGGAAMIRATVEDGIDGIDLGRLSEELSGAGTAFAVVSARD